MKTRILGTLLMSAALTLGASESPKPAPGSDAAIGNQLRRDIVAYSDYSVFDDVAYGVTNGQVNLGGVVTDASKKTAIEKLARSVHGVTSVHDNIQVLTGGTVDNQLRTAIERAIYGTPVFDHYAYEGRKPVRIIVDHGHVTLEGVVQSQLEKDVAGVNAAAVGLREGPVSNNLQVAPAARNS